MMSSVVSNRATVSQCGDYGIRQSVTSGRGLLVELDRYTALRHRYALRS